MDLSIIDCQLERVCACGFCYSVEAAWKRTVRVVEGTESRSVTGLWNSSRRVHAYRGLGMGWGTIFVSKGCVKCERRTIFFLCKSAEKRTEAGEPWCDRRPCVLQPWRKKKNERFCSSLADPISVAAQEVGQRGFCNTTIHSSGVHTTWLSFV